MSYKFSLPFPSRKILWFAAALLCGLIVSASTPSYSNAQTIVSNDWSLKPAGVGFGDSFRLMFVTKARRGGTAHPNSSGSTSTYNTYVQNAANNGHTDIRSHSDGFRIVGSTAFTNARANTGMTDTGTGTPAIYYLGTGAKIADNYDDFYDGSWDTNNRAHISNENGITSTADRAGSGFTGTFIPVLTGSNRDGTRCSPHILRSNNFTCFGRPDVAGKELFHDQGNTNLAWTAGGHFYAMSEVFTVGTVREISLSPASLMIDENSNGTYTAVLESQPTGEVTVSITSSNSNVTVSPMELTFTTDNWDMEQIVTVTAADDDNAVNDDATLTHTASGGDYDSATAELTVTVTDDDTNGVTVSPVTLTVNEDSTATYTVVLDTEPAGQVTVTPTSGDTGIATVLPASLIFTATNWSMEQNVTVTPVADTGFDDENVSITHVSSSTDTGYNSLTVDPVDVDIIDLPPPGITLSETMLTVGEGNLTTTYTAVLDSEPTGTVTVSIRSDNSDVTVLPASLVFTTDNWETAQNVMVTAADDDGAVNDNATLTHTASGANYGSVTATLMVIDTSSISTLRDLRTIPGTTLRPRFPGFGGRTFYSINLLADQGTLAVEFTAVHSGATATATVRASTDPVLPEVSLTLTPGTGGSFTSSSFGIDAGAPRTLDIVVTSMDGSTTTTYSVRVTRAFGVHTMPNNVVATSGIGSISVTWEEPTSNGGQEITGYTAIATPLTGSLTGRAPNPSSRTKCETDGNGRSCVIENLTNGTSYGIAVAAINSEGVRGDFAGFTFDTGIYSIYGRPRHNPLLSGLTLDTGTLEPTFSSDTNEYRAEVNNATSSIVLTPTAATEGDVTPVVTVTADTTVTPGTGEFTVSLNVGENEISVVATASITQDGFTSEVTNTYRLIVNRAPTVGVTVTPTVLTVDEDGRGTYTVTLDTQPTGNVRVRPRPTGITTSGALRFTTDNWNRPQTVTVFALPDLNDVDETLTIRHELTGGDYVGVTIDEVVTVTVIDDDVPVEPGFTLNSTPLTLNEGTFRTYTLGINIRPTADFTVDLTSASTDDVTVTPSVTFTTTNWQTPQIVTVTAVEDDDSDDETVDITHAVTGTTTGHNYHGIDLDTVTVTVVDDDEDFAISLSTDTLQLDEGGIIKDYRVRLTSQPTGNVTVTITSRDSDSVRITKTSSFPRNTTETITFNTANWNNGQRIRVRALTDSDARDEMVTLTHMAQGGGYNGITAELTVNVNDDEEYRAPTVGVTVTPTVLTVDEDSRGTYTVTLDTQPTGNVRVRPTGTTTSGDLRFTTDNWDRPQTVTVFAFSDSNDVDETLTIRHELTGDDYVGVTIDEVVTVTVIDDDVPVEPGFTLNSTPLTLNEGTFRTYTLGINIRPTADFTVELTSGSTDDVTVTPSVTFTTGNWNTPQIVTVTAVEDDDSDDETVDITHAVTGTTTGHNYHGIDLDTITVTVVDDDEDLAISLSTDTLQVDENGNTKDYRVRLTSQPTGNVTVTITSTDSDSVRIRKTTGFPRNTTETITFNTTNWNTGQRIRVRALNDSNARDEMVTLTHMAQGGGYNGITADLTVNVDDDDEYGFFVGNDRSLVTIEEGGNGRYSLRLSSEPSDRVIVRISGHESSPLMLTDGDTLTFTTSNWSSQQFVRVTAGEDDNLESEIYRLHHTATGGDYEGVTSRLPAVISVHDDDQAGITLSTNALTVNEGGGARTYTAVLDHQPAENVVLTPASGNDELSFSPSSLTFTTDNWNIAQTGTVSAGQDDDSIDESSTVNHIVSGDQRYAASANAVLIVTVDDDDRRGITVSPTNLPTPLTEGGAGATYTVRLNTEPNNRGNVTVRPLSNNPDVSFSPLTLVFTTANWNTPQTVTIRAGHDADSADERLNFMSHTAFGSNYDFSSPRNFQVNFTVTDDDTDGVTLSTTTLTVDEGRAGKSYTAVLDTQPSAFVIITPSVSGGGSGVTFSPASVLFTQTNWNTPRNIRVTAADDDNSAMETVTVEHTISGGGYASSVNVDDVVVTVNDDDTDGVTVSPTTLEVNEDSTATYTVVLDTEPAGQVTVTPTSGDTGIATVLPARLMFTATNWSTEQTVTVTPVADTGFDNEDVSITHASSSTDTGYNSLSVDPVTVNVIDERRIDLSERMLTVDEGTSTTTYTAVLNSAPTADVTVTLTSSNSDVTVPATLMFTTSNWMTPQPVTVAAAEDDDAVNDNAAVTHTASGGGYVSATTRLRVRVTDPDTNSFTVSKTQVTVDEGSTETYTVVLDTQPDGDAKIIVTTRENENVDIGINSNHISISPDPDINLISLTFTTDNWETPQTVTVTGLIDPDDRTHTGFVRNIGSEGGYKGLEEMITVVVTDTQTSAGVTVSLPTLTLRVNEDSTATYTLVLDGPPTAQVQITPISGTPAALSVSPATLTFETDNWDTAQTVTASPVADTDFDDVLVGVSHSLSSTDTEYGSVIVDAVIVNIIDTTPAPTPGITLSANMLTVDEGSPTTYTAVLDAEPTGTVTVTLSSDNGDITFQPTSLVFTTDNWDTAQNVMLTAEDDDAVNDNAIVTHTANGGGYGSITANLKVAVTDEDANGITFSETSLTVAEGTSGTYTAVLDTEPTDDVRITFGRNSRSLTFSPVELTFTTDNWDTAQDIMVTAAENSGVQRDITVTHTASGGGYAVRQRDETTGVVTVNNMVTAELSVDITNNPTLRVTLSTNDLFLDEGTNSVYTAVLGTRPTGNVTIMIESDNTDDVTVSPASLTFSRNTPQNLWSSPQRITVTAIADSDDMDESAMLTHSVSGGGYGSVTVDSVTVNVNDTTQTQTPGITLSDNMLTVGEGTSTTTYTAVLDSEPTGTVTVTLRSDNTDVTVLPASLVFTTDNWETAQNVRVTAAEDDDAVTDDPATVTHTASGADYGSVTADLTVEVTENDTNGVTLSTPTLAVNEGATATYTAVLDAEPTGTVTVTPDISDNSDVTFMPANLVFTAADWNIEKTVTVTAAEDDDAVNDDATVRHTASGGGYNSISSVLTVTVTENDTNGVTLSATTLPVDEGATATYTAVLDAEPTGTVTITPDISDNGDVTFMPANLVFTTDDWDTEKTVTITAAGDSDSDNEMATVTHAISGGGYGSVTVDSVTVNVNDTTQTQTPGITLSPTTLTVGEGTSNTTYTAVLDTEPTGEVTVMIESNNTEVTVSPVELTFTTGNWETAQNVMVTAAEDDDAADDTATLTHMVSGGGYDSVTVGNVGITVNDDDTESIIVSETALTVNEGEDGTYTMVLSAEPLGVFTVFLSDQPTGVATVSPATLIFDNGNWNAEQTVTVTGIVDDNAANAQTRVLYNSSSTNSNSYASISLAALEVTVNDPDTNGAAVSVSNLSVNEGTSNTYTVNLTAQPFGEVTIRPAVIGNSDVRVLPASMRFTTQNWNTEQTVTVSASEDSDSTNDTATVTHTVSATATSGYDSVTVDSVNIRVIDNDNVGVTLSQFRLNIDEGAESSYTMVLNTQPSGNVTITPDISDNGDVTFTPANLVFNTTDWNIEKTVTVRAAADDDSADDTATVTHTVSGGGYDSVTAQNVDVTVNDPDISGVTVSVTDLTVAEGTSDTYTVVLETQPLGTVTISPVSRNTAVATVSPPMLIFDATNWNTEQTVTVNAIVDGNSRDETAMITHTTASSDNYDSVTVDSVNVMVIDSDMGFVVTPTTLPITEGETGTYTVVLNTRPSDSVTVRAQIDDTDVATIRPTSLFFTTSNWNMPQIVNVIPLSDDDGTDETATIRHTSSGGNYEGLAVSSVTVNVDDDDAIGIGVPQTVTVTEGQTGTYTARLNTPPSSEVTVAITNPDTATITVSPLNLTFGTDNWDDEQTVTIRTFSDDDSVDQTPVVLTHTASGGDYQGETTTVTVTVEDDDDPGLVFEFPSDSLPSLRVSEGQSATYTVALSTLPSGDVTVTPASANSDLSFSPAVLMFGTGDWNTAQTVTVSAATDTDSENETVAVTHTSSGVEYDRARVFRTTFVVEDRDGIGLNISPSPLPTLVEGGAEQTYTVILNGEPTADVTVAVSSGATDVAAVSPSVLTFRRSNWVIAQTVTVNAVDDPDAADETTVITHAATGGGYGRIVAELAVSVDDDETAGFAVSRTSLMVNEEQSDTYTVALGTQPTVDVTVTPSVTGSGDVTVSPSSLRFTPENWNEEQTVTVSAADDSDSADDTATVRHTADAGEYATVSANLAITVDDNDDPGIVVSVSTLTIDEQESQTYTVALNTEPEVSAVAVTPVSTNSDVTFSPAVVTFSATNWETAQTVTASAGNDGDSTDDTATVTHTARATGSVYDGLTSTTVAVTVRDNEANLSALEISDTTLDPAFDGYTLAYLASVEYTVTDVTVTATPVDAGATVRFTVDGTAVTPDPISNRYELSDLTFGDYEIEIAVTSGGRTNTYALTAQVPMGLTMDQREETHTQTTGTLSHNLAISALGIIGDRLGSNPSFGASATLAGRSVRRMNGDEMQSFIAGELVAGMQSFEDDGVFLDVDGVVERAMRDSEFVMPFGEHERGLTLWGSVGEVSNEGDFDGTSYDGDTVSALIGLDGLVASDWRVGMAIGYSTGEVDYETETPGTDMRTSGEVEKNMISVHPYMSWHPLRGMSLWASGGIGVGEYEISELTTNRVGATTTDFSWESVDALDWMAAVGAEQTFNYMLGFDTSLRVKGLWNRVDIDEAQSEDGNQTLPEITSTNWRVRVETETGRTFNLGSPGTSLRPYGLLSGRWDNGDAVGDDELFIDAGGGVEFNLGAFFVDLSFYRQVNDGDTEENSLLATGAIVFDNSRNGEGLTMSLSRKATGSILSSWQSHAFEDAEANETLNENPAIETKMGYGWRVYPAFVDSALVKTYARSEFEDRGRNHSLGIDFEASKLSIGLESGFEELSEEIQALLRIRMNF